MAQINKGGMIGSMGAATVTDIGYPAGSNHASFSTSTPAGWAMIWWGLATLFLLLILINL